MSTTSIKINGLDVRSEYGLEVLGIKPFSPLPKVRNQYQGMIPVFAQVSPQTITLDGYISGDDNADMFQKIEALAGAISQRACLEIIYFNGSAVAEGGAKYEVIHTGKFDLSHYGKPNRSRAKDIYVKLTFEILAYISPDGIVTQTVNITNRGNYYFEDANCLQGADNVIANFNVNTGGMQYAELTCLAVGERFRHYPALHEGVTTGTPSHCPGPYGNIAIGFSLAGNNTLKFPDFRHNIPIINSHEFTAMIKFKWTGAADATEKVLLCGNVGAYRPKIYINTTNKYARFDMNGFVANVNTPGGAAFSSTDWNTVVVKFKEGGSADNQIFLHIPGQSVASNNGAGQATFTLTPTEFYLGSYPNGTSYRADCYIGEVAVWKYPLSDAACEAAAQSANPIKYNPEHQLNKRLTFYLDFMDGFNAISNEHVSILNVQAMIPGTIILYGSDRHTALMAMATSSGISNSIANITQGLGTNIGIAWPIIERYNNLALLYSDLACNVDFSISYNPRRRS